MTPVIDRRDGRREDELRPVSFERNYTRYAEGSVLVSFGNTRVLCNATVEERVPPFLRGSGKGWITAEYSMLPRATAVRTTRSTARGGPDGRSTEIQRLVGRVLRSAVDMTALGERTIILDCDVLQADGGTRTAAVSGGFVALVDSLRFLQEKGAFGTLPLKFSLAAVSIGKIEGEMLLDLDYSEDCRAEVDMNIFMTSTGDFVEIQGTGEGGVFSPDELQALLSLGAKGIREILDLQEKALDLI
ncbi:ribonuclease PH [Aminivibrio sp.]